MKNFKNIAAVLVAGFLLLSAVSCNKDKKTSCKEHDDADNNGICDVCGTSVETSEEICDDHIDTDEDNHCDICDAVISDPVSYTVVLKDEKGNPMQGASIKLFLDGEELASGTTTEDGRFSGSILPGSYTVSIENVPQGWLVEGNGKTLKIDAENGSFEFKAIDNNPNGTEEKPYFVSEEPVTKLFPAGGELYFSTKGSEKFLVINATDVKVNYNGKEYLPENGVLRVLIAATVDTNSATLFSVVNTSSAEASLTVAFESLPGTAENPFEGKLDVLLSAEVGKEQTVYYEWIADQDGYLVMESDTESNHIMLYNTTSFVVTSYTDGAKSIFVAVKREMLSRLPWQVSH